jgi:hypothetical protein
MIPALLSLGLLLALAALARIGHTIEQIEKRHRRWAGDL